MSIWSSFVLILIFAGIVSVQSRCCRKPTMEPTPTPSPTRRPTSTRSPSFAPSTRSPTFTPTFLPTFAPTLRPTRAPSQPTFQPSPAPTPITPPPSGQPSSDPSSVPTQSPVTSQPTSVPSSSPTLTYRPTFKPTFRPTRTPTLNSRTEVTLDVEITLDETISANLVDDPRVETVVTGTLLQLLTQLTESNINLISVSDPNSRRLDELDQAFQDSMSGHRRLQIDQSLLLVQLVFIIESLGYRNAKVARREINALLQEALSNTQFTDLLQTIAFEEGVDELFNSLVSAVDTEIADENLLFSFAPTSDPARSPNGDDADDDEFYAGWPLFGQIIFIVGVALIVLVCCIVVAWYFCCWQYFAAAGGWSGKDKESQAAALDDDNTSGGSDVEGGNGNQHGDGLRNLPVICCLACCGESASARQQREAQERAAAAAVMPPKKRYRYTSETGQPLKVRNNVRAGVTAAADPKKEKRKGSIVAFFTPRRFSKGKFGKYADANPNMQLAHADQAEVELRCLLEAPSEAADDLIPLTGAVEFDAIEFLSKSEREKEAADALALAQLEAEAAQPALTDEATGGVLDAMMRVFMTTSTEAAAGSGEVATVAADASASAVAESDITVSIASASEPTATAADSAAAVPAAAASTSHIPKFLKAGYWKKKLFKKNEHGEDVEVDVNLIPLQADFATVSINSTKHLAEGSYTADSDAAAEEARLLVPGSFVLEPVQYTPKGMLPPDEADAIGKSTSVDTQGTIIDSVFQAFVLNPQSLQAESAESVVAESEEQGLIPEQSTSKVLPGKASSKVSSLSSRKSDTVSSLQSKEEAAAAVDSSKSGGGLSVLGRMFGTTDDQYDVPSAASASSSSVNGAETEQNAHTAAASDDGSLDSAVSVKSTVSAAAYAMLGALFAPPAESIDATEQEMNSVIGSTAGLPVPPSAAANLNHNSLLMSPFEVDQQSTRYDDVPHGTITGEENLQESSADESLHSGAASPGILKSGTNSGASTPKRRWPRFSIRFAPNTKGAAAGDDVDTHTSGTNTSGHGSDQDDATSLSSDGGGVVNVVAAPRTPVLRSTPSASSKRAAAVTSTEGGDDATAATTGAAPVAASSSFSKPKSVLKSIKRRLSKIRRGSQSSASNSDDAAGDESEGMSESGGESIT